MTAVLRTVQEVDLRKIGDLHFRSRASAYAGFLPAEALEFGGAGRLGEWWAERWKWERDTHRLTVAEADGELVGFTYLGPSEEEGVTELSAIHVAPELVGSGIGRLLMLDALPHLGPRAVLWVLEQNERARRFYERGGWRPDGVTRAAPMGGVETFQLRYSLLADGNA